MHYGSQEKDEEYWRMQNYGERHHNQHHKNHNFHVKLSLFDENFDPNVYLGWEAKVEQIFNVYD